jgi:peptidyl-prolyl cis-trans isomerase SurA
MINYRLSRSAVRAALAALACAWLPLAALAQLAPPEQRSGDIDSIVALVDENVILRSELDAAVANITAQIRARGEAMPPMNLVERQVLENLIMTELQVQRALQTGIRISDADIDQTLVRVAESNGITVQQMRQSLESQGIEFAEFRRDISEQLMADRLQQRIVNSMDPITDTEVDILLASEDASGGEYNVSQILVGLADGSTPQQVSAAEAKANDIYKRLLDGLDFASAAISYSDGREALEGGLIGWRDLNSVPAFFADAVRGLSPGQITEPVRSPIGYHIIKVNDFREKRQVVVKEYNARHIMIEVNELVTPRLAMEQITDIEKRLREGEDFAELAKEYSDDTTTANLGGDMGWFPPGAYGERVQMTIDALEPNGISQPFQTPQGWHIIQLLGERETDRTEDAIRADAREKIMRQRANEEIQKVLRQFRDEAYVEIRLPGYEDESG